MAIMADDVGQKANNVAMTLINWIRGNDNITEEVSGKVGLLASELCQTAALHNLIHHDIICHSDTTPQSLIDLAPVELQASHASFAQINEHLWQINQTILLPATSTPNAETVIFVEDTCKAIKGARVDIRADVILAIKQAIQQIHHLPHAVRLRDVVVASDPSLEHYINLIRIQRGDAPVRAPIIHPSILSSIKPDALTPVQYLQAPQPTILEIRLLSHGSPDNWRAKAHKLAAFLHESILPTLPHCTGFRVNKADQRLEYVYAPSEPLASFPRTLESLSAHLDSAGNAFIPIGKGRPALATLANKTEFACSLARALSNLHAVGRAHGALHRSNVWFSSARVTPGVTRVSTPLLVGFSLREDGEALEEAKMADMRALGVLLVEIARGEVVGGDAVAGTKRLIGSLGGTAGKGYIDAAGAALYPEHLTMTFASLGGVGGLDRAFRGVVLGGLLRVIGQRG